MTFPSLNLEIPSPNRGESFDKSSTGTSLNIENSEPNFLINLSYSLVTDLLAVPTCIISEIISGSGTRL